jgi:hypothetical protein
MKNHSAPTFSLLSCREAVPGKKRRHRCGEKGSDKKWPRMPATHDQGPKRPAWPSGRSGSASQTIYASNGWASAIPISGAIPLPGQLRRIPGIRQPYPYHRRCTPVPGRHVLHADHMERDQSTHGHWLSSAIQQYPGRPKPMRPRKISTSAGRTYPPLLPDQLLHHHESLLKYRPASQVADEVRFRR